MATLSNNPNYCVVLINIAFAIIIILAGLVSHDAYNVCINWSKGMLGSTENSLATPSI